ncbi:MAG TPA: hypothetical protein VLV81_10150 [Acidimicrobiia bacterium]|nr:hypothetical protein [Acidimicrobiia bacterium]
MRNEVPSHPQPPGVRTARPGDGEGPGAPTDFEEISDSPRTPDERSGVRILRPDDRSAEPRRQVRQVPPPGETLEPDLVDVDDEEPVHTATRDRVLGVNFVGDVAYLAVVEPPDRASLDLADQLQPAAQDDDSRRLANFSARTSRILRDLGIAVVAVARPLRYTNWTYAAAFERVSLETCIMLEAQRLSLRFESVGQHHAANVIGLPAQQLTDSLPARLRIPKTVDWPNRYPAVLVALAVALEM